MRPGRQLGQTLVPATVAAVAATAMVGVLAGCGGETTQTSTSPAAGRVLEIATDLPLQGGAKESSEETNQAIKLYLEQVGNTAGDFAVTMHAYDDSTAARGAWDPEACVRNAHDHLLSNEVAVMGALNSGCARLMVPVMNRALNGPLVMVSHNNTNPGLTKPWGPNEPAKFAPSGHRSFARVVATDDKQGAAGAAFLSSALKVKRCYLLHDGDVYGRGVTKAFATAAPSNGIKVVGIEPWDVGLLNYRSMFEKIRATGPDCVYMAGTFGHNAGMVVRDKVAVLGDNKKVPLMASDGFVGYPELIAAPAGAGMYLSSVGLAIDELPKTSPNARAFLAAYKSRYGQDMVSSKSIYGVAAVQLIRAAIAASDGTRKGLHQAIFGSTDLTVPAAESITGRDLTIDRATGDITSADISILQIRRGKETFVTGKTIS